jgi:hypothetical protein
VSPDGRDLACRRVADGEIHVWMVPLESDEPPRRLTTGLGGEWNPKISPDGRWVAYESNRTGRGEVYVQAAAIDASASVVSSSGGTRPRWSSDSLQVYYLSSCASVDSPPYLTECQEILAVPVRDGEPRGRAEAVIDATAAGGSLLDFDVAPDGRLLLLVQGSGRPSKVEIIVNWQSLLHRGPSGNAG